MAESSGMALTVSVSEAAACEPHPGLEKARAILAELSPRPKLKSPRPRTRIGESAAVLTSSPYKKMLSDKSVRSASRGKQGSSMKNKKSSTQSAKSTKKRKIVAEADETPCCICLRKYNEPPVDSWSSCRLCGNWYHDSCGPDDDQICYKCVP